VRDDKVSTAHRIQDTNAAQVGKIVPDMHLEIVAVSSPQRLELSVRTIVVEEPFELDPLIRDGFLLMPPKEAIQRIERLRKTLGIKITTFIPLLDGHVPNSRMNSLRVVVDDPDVDQMVEFSERKTCPLNGFIIPALFDIGESRSRKLMNQACRETAKETLHAALEPR
jgi:hypothetical protein